MQSYLLQHHNKKVLAIDIDPQANLTYMISQTYHKEFNPTRKFYDGFCKGNLKDSISHVTKDLDIIPGDDNMNNLVDRIAQIHSSARFTLLRKMIAPLKKSYDYILLDVPPTLNDLVMNAIFASDGISIVLQTQKLSYISALKTVGKFIYFKKHYHPNFHFLGVILYLYSKTSHDKDIINSSKKTFKDALYPEAIKFQERVKGFTSDGIKDRDHWDKRAIGNYSSVNKAIIKRANKVINNG